MSGISPPSPIACQVTELGLNRTRAPTGRSGSRARVAATPSAPREMPSAATSLESTSGRRDSHEIAVAKRSSGMPDTGTASGSASSQL
ncbi:Uncharacterised protein [Mycobacteroides abscessus subsp. abscessus]|nr:Uncharacterised protein [Mycobacteroides abscessus subsp. abscessus]